MAKLSPYKLVSSQVKSPAAVDSRHRRTRQDLRLVSGKDLVEMIFENYDKPPAERKRLLPMRSGWVIDKDPGVL